MTREPVVAPSADKAEGTWGTRVRLPKGTRETEGIMCGGLRPGGWAIIRLWTGGGLRPSGPWGQGALGIGSEVETIGLYTFFLLLVCVMQIRNEPFVTVLVDAVDPTRP